MTLAGALKEGLLLVAEVSESGSVPEILITNKAPKPVLILDGEELRGAKQNRASNTTVLVPANSEMKLNVSCTERGRWHYDSERFADSGVVMAHGVRRAKSASVSEGFRMRRCALSDQAEVWDEIERLHETTGTVSPTRAMRDAFESQETTMEACLAAFTLVEGQHGFVFVANGAAMGLDFLSREEAYGDVHKRLLGSYVMEMLSESGETNGAPDGAVVRQFMERRPEGHALGVAGLSERVRAELDRWVEKNDLLDAMGNQAGTICFSPLAQGLLTSRYLDGNVPEGSRASENRFLKADSITKERVALLGELNEVAKRRGQSLSELAISWLLKNEKVTSVLIGASSKAQLLQNLKALDKPSTFSSEELSELDAILQRWE